MTPRLREILSMPPEPLEMLSGVGALIWSTSWLRLLMMQSAPRGPAYQDLAALPALVQALLLLVAVQGAVIQIAAAWVNEARLRFVADVSMAAFFLLVLTYVWWRVGFSPTAACYIILIMGNVTAAAMLRLSGFVRL